MFKIIDEETIQMYGDWYDLNNICAIQYNELDRYYSIGVLFDNGEYKHIATSYKFEGKVITTEEQRKQNLLKDMEDVRRLLVKSNRLENAFANLNQTIVNMDKVKNMSIGKNANNEYTLEVKFDEINDRNCSIVAFSTKNKDKVRDLIQEYTEQYNKYIEIEFNRLYGNLNELYKRTNDKQGRYPKDICVAWFVETASEILSNNKFREKLTAYHISNIANKASNLKELDIANNKQNKQLDLIIAELDHMSIKVNMV